MVAVIGKWRGGTWKRERKDANPPNFATPVSATSFFFISVRSTCTTLALAFRLLSIIGCGMQFPLRLALLYLLALGMTQVCFGAVEFEMDGIKLTTSTPQLWYEGYWKQVDWINGSVYAYPTNLAAGNIVVVHNWRYPYDSMLRELAKMNPKAVVVVQDTTGFPGDGMYSIDGDERRSINIPVCEVYSSKSNNFSRLPDGTEVHIQFEPNAYKKIKDGLFYPIVNSLMSIWEIFIAILGAYHLYLFILYDPSFSFLSIGPLCLSLEIIATLLRFSHTIVDPFWSARLIPHVAQNVLMTVHLPFLLASGVLLTFYWTETLKKSSIKATPFITHYRKVAIAAVIGLFLMEIITVILRVAIAKPLVEPVIFSVVYYLLVSITLATCYIVCCVAIVRRVTNLGSRKYSQIKAMNIRFTLSSCGYISLVILEVLTYFSTHRKWAPVIVWYLLYVALNTISTLQVHALQPINRFKSSYGTRESTQHSSNAAGTT